MLSYHKNFRRVVSGNLGVYIIYKIDYRNIDILLYILFQFYCKANNPKAMLA